MPSRITLTLAVIICTLGAVACDEPAPLAPEIKPPSDTTPPDPPFEPVLRSAWVYPGYFTVIQGGDIQLRWGGRDQRSAPIQDLGEIVFASSDTTVARVSPAGLVTGFQPGSATISATIRLADASRTATMRIAVADSTPRLTLELHRDWGPWEPNPATLSAGGLVTWYSRRDLTVYIWDELETFFDSVMVTDGSGSRLLDIPGRIHYCVDCMDPDDGGVIHVR